MRYTLTITGSLEDMHNAIEALKRAPFSEVLRRVTHVNHPQDFQNPTFEQGETIGEYKPEDHISIRPMERIIKPSKMSKPKAETVVTEKKQRNCHTCGALFMPKRKDSITCSKACYMVRWFEIHKPKKDLIKLEEPELKDADIPAEVPPEYPHFRAEKTKEMPVRKVARTAHHKKVTKSPKGENFRIFLVNGKPTQVSGTDEQLDNFESRLKNQTDMLSRKHVKAPKAMKEITEFND